MIEVPTNLRGVFYPVAPSTTVRWDKHRQQSIKVRRERCRCAVCRKFLTLRASWAPLDAGDDPGAFELMPEETADLLAHAQEHAAQGGLERIAGEPPRFRPVFR
jgi:hypothetical protein